MECSKCCVFYFQNSQSVNLLPSSDENMVMLNSKCYTDVLSLKNVVIFQFNGPLYFATISLFKRKLQAAVDSLNNKEEGITLTESRDEHKVRYQSVESIQQKVEIEEGGLKVDDVRVKDDNEPLQVEIEEGELKVDYVRVKNGNEPLKPSQNLENLDAVPHNCKVVVVNCCCIPFMDTGGATALAQLHQAYSKHRICLVMACCTDDVLAQFKQVAQCRPLLSTSVFPSVPDALMAATLNVVDE